MAHKQEKVVTPVRLIKNLSKLLGQARSAAFLFETCLLQTYQ